jgi:hypothetical protein
MLITCLNIDAIEAGRPASAALIVDLKQRGLLDDTLVIWGGEFGRTAYCRATDRLTTDHHGRCFTMCWRAQASGGMTFGASDDYGYGVAKDPFVQI